jgi:hypothetical protein
VALGACEPLAAISAWPEARSRTGGHDSRRLLALGRPACPPLARARAASSKPRSNAGERDCISELHFSTVNARTIEIAMEPSMAKASRDDAQRAARLAAHWRARADEYGRLGRHAEAVMAQSLAASYGRARAAHFSSDFCITSDGRPVYAEIDGEPIAPEIFLRRLRSRRP